MPENTAETELFKGSLTLKMVMYQKSLMKIYRNY